MSPILVLVLAVVGEPRPAPVPMLLTPGALGAVEPAFRRAEFCRKLIAQERETIAKLERDLVAVDRELAGIDPLTPDSFEKLHRKFREVHRRSTAELLEISREHLQYWEAEERRLSREVRPARGVRQELLRRWDDLRRLLRE